MKFKTKLVIYIIVTIALILSCSRYFVVRQNFVHSIESNAKQNAAQYTLERYMLESNIIKNIQEGEHITDEKIIEFVKQLYEYTGNNLEKIAIYKDNEEEIFSNFENLESVDIISILNQETDNYYLKQIGDKQYMIFSSYWSINNEGRYIVNAYDITRIYEERNNQMYEILLADIIILIVSTMFIIIISTVLTNPIKRLNETSKKIATGQFSERVNINTDDEIGELANSFNIMAEQIESKIKELNVSIQQKDDFISGFTHEIKNPMTTIVGYSDLLRLRKCDEETSQKALNYIYTEGKRLEKISYKLMQLMAITEEKIELEKIQIVDYINKIVRNEKMVLENIEVELNIERAVVKGDKELLEVVIRNIIENAKKAEPKDNKITINGKLINNKYKLEVIDKGKGIPKEHINKVTQSFYMVDKSRTKSNGGSGIGLALCKKILEAHNSNIKIESEEGIKTIVSFELEVDK